MMKKLTIFFVLLLSLGETWGQNVKPELRVQVGHNIQNIISLSGGDFLTTDGISTIKHWHLETGKLIRTFNGKQVLLLADSSSFLTNSIDSTIKHWDLETGKLLQIFKGSVENINKIIFHPDSTVFLCIDNKLGNDGIKCYDFETGEVLYSIPVLSGLDDIFLMSDMKTFMTLGAYGYEHWDLKTGEHISNFPKNINVTNREILILPDSTTFLTLNEKRVEYWSLETGELIKEFKVQSPISFSDDFGQLYMTSLTLQPNNKSFFASTYTKYYNLETNEYVSGDTTRYWNLETGNLIHTFTGKCIGSFTDNKTVFTVSYKNDINFTQYWDLETGNLIYKFAGKFVKLLQDGNTILTESIINGDYITRYWDLGTGKLLATFNGNLIKLFPKKNTLLTNGDNLSYWDLKTGKLLHNFEIIFESIIPNTTTFLGHDREGLLSYRDLETGEVLTSFPLLSSNSGDNHEDEVTEGEEEMIIESKNIEVFPDLGTFLTDYDSKIQYWDLKTGKLLHTFVQEPNDISYILTHSKGETFFSAGRIWNLKNGISKSCGDKSKLVRFFTEGQNLINVYKNDNESFIGLWDLKTAKLLENFNIQDVFPYYIFDIISLPEANQLIALETNGKVVSWDLKTKEKENIHTIENYDEFDLYPIESLVLAKTLDGKGLLIGDKGSIYYKDTELNSTLRAFKQPSQVESIIIIPNTETFLSLHSPHRVKEKVGVDSYTYTFVGPSVIYWNLKTGKLIHNIELSGSDESIVGILLLPDGKTFLSIDVNKIKYCDLTTGKLIRTFEEVYVDSIKDVLILPDNKTFLSKSAGNEIKHLSLETGELISTFKGFTGDILLSIGKHSFLSNSDNSIKHWDFVSNKQLGEFISRYGKIKDLQFLGDLDKFLTINEEPSITIWDFNNYQEICTIIPKVDNNKDFVITTPDNYYFATKGGVNDLVHYVIGNQVYLFSQFDLQYNRPDIVLERIGLASDTLIQTYRLAYQKRLEKMGFSEKRIKVFMNGEFEKDFNAPEIELLGKGNFVFEETTQSEYTFSFTAKDAKYNIERIFVNVDGVPLYGAKGDILKNPVQNLKESTIKVPLIAGKNIITLSVINEQGVASLEKRLEITYNPPQPTKPTLYVFSIGVNEYQDKNITKLDYAVKDAEKVTEIFAQNKENFAVVKNFTLTNTEVNKDIVLKLRQELLKTKPEDMVIFNFAGHGFLDDSTNYYLGTYDTDLDKLPQTGLKYDEVESLLDNIPARKKLMFIDACHSGEVDKEGLSDKFTPETRPNRRKSRSDGTTYEVNVLSQTAFDVMKASFSDLRIGTGTTVISASGGLEAATEDYTWGHGAFTYTLIQGLQEKKADLDKNGKITVSELQTYLAEEVQRLTDGFQKPTSRIENIVNDFVLWE